MSSEVRAGLNFLEERLYSGGGLLCGRDVQGGVIRVPVV
jgi:hypothetical protein